MYYKLENSKSEIYQKLFALRTEEIKLNKEILNSIKNKIIHEWEGFLGSKNQQDWNRLHKYIGFKFKNPKELNAKIWKEHKDYKGIFVPNKRTLIGRDMDSFLSNLPSSSFRKIFDILGVPLGRRFTFPFLDIGKDNVILLYLGNNVKVENDSIIEITSKEFESLRK